MRNYKIERLMDKDPLLCQKLKQFCYDMNGCCQTVHRDMGPFLNEYMYQDALEIMLKERNIPFEREYYFSVEFHGQLINHKHYVDFRCKEEVFIECKATQALCPDHRQQLWNYMRLTKQESGCCGILRQYATRANTTILIQKRTRCIYFDKHKNMIG